MKTNRFKVLWVLILLLVAAGTYQIGWYRGLGYDTFTSSLAYGTVELGAAWMLRKRDIPGALKLLESDIHGASVAADAFKSDVPKTFVDAFHKFSANAAEYKKQFPDAWKTEK